MDAAATRRRCRSLRLGVRAELDDRVEGCFESGLEAELTELLLHLMARLNLLLLLLAALDHLLVDPSHVLVVKEVLEQEAAAWCGRSC